MVIARPLGQHWTFGHQFSQPIALAAVPAAASSWGFVPLGLLCVALGLLGFVAAIVLSLIPIYTRNHSVPPQVVSSPFDTTFLTGNGTLSTGPLSASDRLALQTALNNFLARDRRFSGCTVNLNSANVQNCPSTRRILQKRGRRRRRQQQRQSAQKRVARQTSGNCVDQQILTTSTLTCSSCFGACLRRRATLLQTLLPNFIATVTFPNSNQTISVVGTNVPLSPTPTPTTTTTTTTIPTTTTTIPTTTTTIPTTTTTTSSGLITTTTLTTTPSTTATTATTTSTTTTMPMTSAMMAG